MNARRRMEITTEALDTEENQIVRASRAGRLAACRPATVPANAPTPRGGYQPRFVAYARYHGRTPAQQLEHDQGQYSGGCMAGFICWISTQLGSFYAKHPEAFVSRDTLRDQEAFTRFLRGVATKAA